MANPNVSQNKSLSLPMGLIMIGGAAILGSIGLFGLTAYYFFIKFMTSDLMQTGIPIWVILVIGYVVLILRRNNRMRQ